MPYKGMSDYIDYWAIDWDHRGDVLMQDWRPFARAPIEIFPWSRIPHLPQTGRYRIAIKVIDIFGTKRREPPMQT